MVDINAFWLMIIYILSSILIISLIVLVIKLIFVVTKVNNIVDDVNLKFGKFNNFFSVVDTVNDRLSFVSDKVIEYISVFLKNIFVRKGKDDNNEEK